jgi:hypothetical protein
MEFGYLMPKRIQRRCRPGFSPGSLVHPYGLWIRHRVTKAIFNYEHLNILDMENQEEKILRKFATRK